MTWGRLVESAVGAHLVNAGLDVTYWREANSEVDYVVRHEDRITAIEVKSGSRARSLSGFAALADRHRIDRRLVVGGDGVALSDFLASPPERFVGT